MATAKRVKGQEDLSPILDLCKRVLGLTARSSQLELSAPLSPKQLTVLRQIYLLTTKIEAHLNAMLVLARGGWGIEALILLRTMVESAATGRLLLVAPDEALYGIIQDAIRAQKEYIAWALTPPKGQRSSVWENERRKEVERDISESKVALQEFFPDGVPDGPLLHDHRGRPRPWRRIPVREKLLAAGMTDAYGPFYAWPSAHLHAGGGSFAHYLPADKQTPWHVRAEGGPKPGLLPMALLGGAKVLLFQLCTEEKAFGLRPNVELAQLAREVSRLLATWGERDS